MARDRRLSRTPPAGPGRTKRSRTGFRTSRPESADNSLRSRVRGRAASLPPGLGLTPRALAVITVLVLLALSYANSLRIYLNQEDALATARVQIQERSERVAALEDELQRWNDPAFVKAQARDRLGWVLPGETGYRVIGPDGKPMGGGVVIVAEQQLPAGEHEPMWWDRLWGSVQTADAPAKKLG
ncbi:MAG: septum formation initiator family protein [Micropruina sp.]|nr:septum formation initiator family protein [Micropruina sp.]